MSGGLGRITESWVYCTASGHWAIVFGVFRSLGSLLHGLVGFRDEVQASRFGRIELFVRFCYTDASWCGSRMAMTERCDTAWRLDDTAVRKLYQRAAAG